MAKNIFETLMGAVVLVVALGFVITAYRGSSVKVTDGYELTARFDRADGLVIGSDVRVSGIKVGSVTAQTIDPQTFSAVVGLSVDDAVKLPNDSSAEIVSDGLLGGKYLALVPGGSNDVFKDGDTVQFTQSSVNFESLIGKFMFGSAEDKDSKSSQDKTPGNSPDKKESSVF